MNSQSFGSVNFQMNNMREFVVDSIFMIYKGTLSQKVNASLQLAVAPALAISLTERLSHWYIKSEFFLLGLCFVLATDHILGSWVHWTIKRDFCWKKNSIGFFTKLCISLLGFSTLSIIDKILEPIDFFQTYFNVLVQLMVILYPASSALSNMSILTDGKFPPSGLLDKIKNFNKTADINELKPKQDEKNT